MRKYEVMYIIRPDIEQEAVQAAVDKFQGIISNGGEITKHEVQGKRRLAYEIKKFRDGVYEEGVRPWVRRPNMKKAIKPLIQACIWR